MKEFQTPNGIQALGNGAIGSRPGNGSYSQIIRYCTVMFTCTVYPLFVMRDVFFTSRSTRLGEIVSDMNGTLFEIQSYRYRQFPWSTTLRSSFPIGDSFWEVNRIVHGLIWTISWCLVQIFSPMFTLNLLVLGGWVISGFGVYCLSKKIGVSEGWSLIAGVLTQMLPWYQLKATDHLFYMYIGVPLLVILASLNFRDEPTITKLALILSGIITLFFIDTYLLVFSLFGILVVGLEMIITRQVPFCSIVRNRRNKFIRFIYSWKGLVTVFPTCAVFLIVQKMFQEFNNELERYGSKSRAITPINELVKWTGVPSDLVTPLNGHWIAGRRFIDLGNTDIVTYGTLVAPALVLAAICVGVLRKEEKVQWLLFCMSIIFVLLALKPVIIFGLPVSLSAVARLFTPGIRVYARAAIIGQVLIVVLAIWFADKLLRQVAIIYKRLFLSFLVVVFFVIDLSPMLKPATVDFYERYSQFEQIIRDSGASGGLLLPSGRLEPLELSVDGAFDSIDIPIHNDRRRDWEASTYLYASLGPSHLAKYLLRNSVDFVVARTSHGLPVIRGYIQDAVRFTTFLDEPSFTELATTVTSQGDQVALLRVNHSESFDNCRECSLAQFITVPQLDHLGASGGGLIDDVFWSPSQEVQLIAEGLIYPDSNKEITVVLQLIALDPNATFVVRDNTGAENSEKLSSGTSRFIRVTTFPGDPIKIGLESGCDSVQVVNGRYCWGFGAFLAYQQRSG